MLNVTSNCGASVVCVAVKSASVFPDLVPFTIESVFPSHRRAKPILGLFGASCKEVLASLPLFDLCLFIAMLVFANV